MWTVAVCGQRFAEAHQEMEVSRTDPTMEASGGCWKICSTGLCFIAVAAFWGCKESRVLVTTGTAVFEWDLSGAF